MRVTWGKALSNSGDSFRFPGAETKGAITLQWREQLATTLSPLKCLCPRSSEIVATFQSRCGRPITVDDTDVEVFFLVKLRHRPRENGIEAPMSFKAPKGTIDAGVVNLRSPIFILFDLALFPLTPDVQQFQNVV